MIRTALAFLLALALTGCGPDEPRADMPLPSPALWKLTGPDGKPAGWLFGTIHALPDGVEWRTPAIDSAIDNADMLVVEVEDLEDGGHIAATFSRLGYTDGMPPLGERVPPRLRGKLRAMLEEGGYREADFAAIETWAAALMLAQLAGESEGKNGIDRALVREFGGRNVVELEGVEGQFAIFDSLAEADQRDLLGAVVEEDTMSAGDTAKLARMWLAGDMDAIAAEGDTGMLRDTELRAALLTERNRAWAQRIAGILLEGRRPLIAVGAAHLAPPEGLPELLAAAGFKVERVAQ